VLPSLNLIDLRSGHSENASLAVRAFGGEPAHALRHQVGAGKAHAGASRAGRNEVIAAGKDRL